MTSSIIYSLSEQPETAFETFLTISRDKARVLELLEIEEASICSMSCICNDMKRYEMLISMGELYSRLSGFKEAFGKLNETLDLCRQNNISHGEILALYQPGNLFEKTGDSEEAVECRENCLKLTDSLLISQYRILSEERLVGYYSQAGNYEKALKIPEMIRKQERDYRDERLRHTISIYDQGTRIEDPDQERQAWRKRSGELEKIRSDKEESIRKLKTIRDIGQELTASLDPDKIIEILIQSSYSISCC